MRDFYDQIAGLCGTGHLGRSVPPAGPAEWLDFPGCVFVRSGFKRAEDKSVGAVIPGLFLSIALDSSGEGGRHLPGRPRDAETRLSTIALREPTESGESILHDDTFVAGLAFPRVSIDRLGLEEEFLDFSKAAGSSTVVCSLSSRPRLLAIAAEMLSLPFEGNAARLLLSAHAAEILARALSCLRYRAELDPVAGQKRMRLQSAKDAIDADLSYAWSIAELARRSGLSRRSFNLEFRKAYGESAIDYLRNKRLDTARDILLHQRLSVTEAAYQVGYAHAANFATAFRRRFGYSPSRFR